MSNRASRLLQADWPIHISYDKDQSEVDMFYSTIKGAISDRNSDFYNKRQVDIFLFAMAIGKELNARKKIKAPSQSIRRDALTEEEMWLMCSVALSEKDADLDVLADSKKIVSICEEYSNGGINKLIQMENQIDPKKEYEEFLEKAINKQEDGLSNQQ